MHADPGTGLERLIEAARAGSATGLGELLQLCRPYLLLVANSKIDPQIRGKVGASDLVQDTFLEAQRDFKEFRGCSHEQLLGWLRRILLNNLANASRGFLDTGKRQLQKERSLDDAGLGERRRESPGGVASPSGEAIAREEVEQLERALGGLPETYQQVIRLRQQGNQTFAAIGTSMGCSAEAARKLWARAVERLRQELGDSAP